MKVIILSGIPGSGKSSFAKKYPTYTVISQDELGSRSECLKAFRQALNEQKNIIVDRCNINRMQRLLWIKEAQKFGVTDINCVYFDVNPETCVKRISERKGHKTITEQYSFDKCHEIVYNFVNSAETVQLEEGFKKILFIDNN